MKIGKTVGKKMSRIAAAIVVAIQVIGMHPALVHGQSAEPLNRIDALVVEEASKEIRAKEGGSVAVGDAEILIPAGALAKDTVISIKRLAMTRDTGEHLANVTAGGGGYRFEPAGLQFTRAATIRIGYSENIEGKPGVKDDIKTYFYNEKEKKWEGLQRLGLDEERKQVISCTMHFTDMINGTLALPEGPKPLSFNLNSIKGLEAADPSSGVAKIQGLEGGSTGSGSFEIKLELPGGRRGMAPSVAIGYSSDGGSGVMGRGFDLRAGGNIRTDTRWGLPAYDTNDRYILDGAILIETGREGNAIHYRRSRESVRNEITRYVSANDDHWEVTDPSGRVKVYGKRGGYNDTNRSWAGPAEGVKYEWELEEERDVYGNTIRYEYEVDEGKLYLKDIYYTEMAGENEAGPYRVMCKYNSNRDDIRIDGRGRYTNRTGRLLERVRVLYGSRELRSYLMEYEVDEFGTSQLVVFGQENGAGGYFWKYEFSYQGTSGLPKINGVTQIYGPTEKWEGIGHGTQVTSGSGSGSEGSISGGIGIGVPYNWDVRVTGGGRFASSASSSETQSTLVDLDGDGRPDSVWRDGNNLYYVPNEIGGFGSPGRIRFDGVFPKISKEESTNDSGGWNVYGGVGANVARIDLGVSYARTTQTGTTTTKGSFLDIDGDGFVDYIESGATEYNKNSTDLGFTTGALQVDKSLGIPSPVKQLSSKDKENYHKNYYIQTPFRSWRAPYRGTVTVEQTVESKRATGMAISADGVYARTYKGADSTPFENIFLGVQSGNGAQVDTASRNRKTAMERGGALYFISDSVYDTRGDDLAWGITVRYSDIGYLERLGDFFEYLPPGVLTESKVFGIFNGGTGGLYTKVSDGDPAKGIEATYQLNSGWEHAGVSADNFNRLINSTLTVKVPKILEGEYFTKLMDAIGSSTGSSAVKEAAYEALFTFYRYDAGLAQYCMNGDQKERIRVSQGIGAWNQIVSQVASSIALLSSGDKAKVLAYTMPDGSLVQPQRLESGEMGYEKQQGSVETWIWYPGPGTQLYLDTIKGNELWMDTVTKEVRLGGEVYGTGAI